MLNNSARVIRRNLSLGMRNNFYIKGFYPSPGAPGQKVEHYEIATYGALARVAKTLGHDDVARILESTLAEEKEADESLTELAESKVNEMAAEEEK